MDTHKSERLVVMLTPAEAQRIQEFRFANRISSKAEATRSLIREGLKQLSAKCSSEAETAPGDEIGVLTPDAVEA